MSTVIHSVVVFLLCICVAWFTSVTTTVMAPNVRESVTEIKNETVTTDSPMTPTVTHNSTDVNDTVTTVTPTAMASNVTESVTDLTNETVTTESPMTPTVTHNSTDVNDTVATVCTDQLDVGVILDQSTSIVAGGDSTNWDIYMLGFVKGIITSLITVANSPVRIGVVSFSTYAKVSFDFERFNRTDQMIAEVNSWKQHIMAGGTNMAKAFRVARTELFNESRSGVKKIVILITDGQSNEETDRTLIEANLIKGDNIEIFSIGITNQINTGELHEIASDEKDKHFFNVSSFDELSSLVVSINNSDCHLQITRVPLVTTTTTVIASVASTTPTVSPSTENTLCIGQADIGIILDESTSIIAGSNYTNWDNYVLGFVKSIVGSLPIGANMTRVGVVSFSTDAKVSFGFNRFDNIDDMLAEVDSWKHHMMTGDTNMAQAFRVARTGLFNESRSGVKKVAILMTDGQSNLEADQTLNEVDLIKEQHVEVFCIGVTNQVNHNQLRTIASSPADTHYFNISSFDELLSLEVNLGGDSCDLRITPMTTTTTTPTTTTTTTVVAADMCSTTNIDLAFLVDSSTKPGNETSWTQMLRYVSAFIGRFVIGPTAVRVAFVRYADDPTVIFQLDTHANKTSVQAAVGQVQYTGGGSNVTKALDVVRTEVFNESLGRCSAWKVAVVITDQIQPVSENGLRDAINRMRDADIRMYAVGINQVGGGKVLDEDAIYKMSHFPGGEDPWMATWVNGYNDLPNKVAFTAGYVCTYTAPPPQCTTPNPGNSTTTASPSPPDCPCTTTNINLAFLVDSSTKSNSSSSWPAILNYVTWVIDQFDVGPTAVRVAFIRYADDPTVIFQLDTHVNKTSVQAAVGQVQYTGGGSNVTKALDVVRTQVFNSSSLACDRWNVAVVVTDQIQPVTTGGLLETLELMQSARIRMYGVGIAESDRLVDPNSLFQLSYQADQTDKWQAVWSLSYAALFRQICPLVGHVCRYNPQVPTCTVPDTTVTSTVRPTTECTCGTPNIDLAFVVDSSTKPDNATSWNFMLQFVSDVIDQFEVGPSALRVAFVRYADDPTVIFQLDTHANKSSVQAAVGQVQYTGGGSNVTKALDVVRTDVFNETMGRCNTWKVAVVVTDEIQPVSENGLRDAINRMRVDGIRTYAVGIIVAEKAVDTDSVYQLSYHPKESNHWQATWVTKGYSYMDRRVCQLTGYLCSYSTAPLVPCPTTAAPTVVPPTDTENVTEPTNETATTVTPTVMPPNITENVTDHTNETVTTEPPMHNSTDVNTTLTTELPMTPTVTHNSTDVNETVTTALPMTPTVTHNSTDVNETVTTAPHVDNVTNTTTVTSPRTVPTTTTTTTTLRPTIGHEILLCTTTNIDMVVVVDSSSKSNSYSSWMSIIYYAIMVVDDFDVRQSGVRVAFVRYADEPSLVFELGKYANKADVQAAIKEVAYAPGGSNLTKALELVRTGVFDQARPDAHKVAIVITDQLQPVDVNGLSSAISASRTAGIQTFAVGIKVDRFRMLDVDALDQLSLNRTTIVYGYFDLINKVCRVVEYACVDGTPPTKCTSPDSSVASATRQRLPEMAVLLLMAVITTLVSSSAVGHSDGW